MIQDIQFCIECLSGELVKMLMDRYGWDMEQAIDQLYTSEVFAKLNDPSCGLWYEGAVYIFEYLQCEIETGSIA